ncbi:MAG: ATP-binding protein, partial [Planctomycetota bacterium]
VNAAARNMLLSGGLNPIGRPILELSRVPEVARTVQLCLAEGTTIQAEATITGTEFDRVLQLDARPLADEVRGRWGCVMVVRDLSELRRLEEVRRDFVANVSHELKTPLTSMRAHLETVLDDPDMPEGVREKFLDKALTNTQRLAAIVADLLSIARFESSEVPMEMERVEFLKIVEEAVRDARSSAERGQVSIELAPLPGALPVYANPEALRMAVSNLLENAIKYSDPEETVQLALRSSEGRAILDVEDRGPGIPAGEQERIFERFYRVDRNRSRELGGTGLGLSIVRNVMRRHGGEVRLESQIGRGSTFTIEIPLASR